MEDCPLNLESKGSEKWEKDCILICARTIYMFYPKIAGDPPATMIGIGREMW